jgi:hypothetical protein
LADTDQDMDLHKLIVFWADHLILSTPSNTCSLRGNSWSLALKYLEIGKSRTARNLLLNGSFLQEAFHNPMLRIMVSLRSGQVSFLPRYEVAKKACESLTTLQLFLERSTPLEYCNLNTFGIENNMNDIVSCVSNNWQEGKGMASNGRLGLSRADTRVICIVLMDEYTEEKVKIEIGRLAALKSMFNNYAEAVEMSLRSLCFSYKGTALFLSLAKNMTPDQLDMNDLDTIMVTNMDRISEGLEGNATTTGATHSHNHGHLLSRSNARKKSKKKRATPLSLPYSVERTHEELKIEVRLACLVSVDNYFFGKRAHISYLSFFFQHSKVLTKLHEEAHPLFVQI